MLDTLNRYVQGSTRGSRPGLQDWSPGAGLDPRWRAVVALSIVGHILFYATIITLDLWVYRTVKARRAHEPEQAVKVTMLAPSEGGRSGLRAPPEHLELIDPLHLKLEAGPDDTRLSPRPPNPATRTASAIRAPGNGSGDESNPQPQPASASVRGDQPRSQPPGARRIQAPEVPASDTSAMAALPVSPAGQPPAPAAGEKQPPKQGGGGPSGEDATKSNKLAIRSERSQYVAYVRQKIERINQRIMPKDYVETTIAREVVSVFSLVVERSGRVRAIRLEESCGYSTLDKIARQAISMAEPFEGYPAELPETFEMTVLVHYH